MYHLCRFQQKKKSDLEFLRSLNVKTTTTMSCNGCRVLRKGCSDTCVLRPCLQWIDSAEAQSHATLFLAKFFGRAGLMSFVSAVPDSQRPALFRSLLFEACGRTVNPVNGAVGLLWTANWHVCQAAVETVLRGGTPRPMPELLPGGSTDRQSDADLDLRIATVKSGGRREGSPSTNSEESVMTTCFERGGGERKLLNLFF